MDDLLSFLNSLLQQDQFDQRNVVASFSLQPEAQPGKKFPA